MGEGRENVDCSAITVVATSPLGPSPSNQTSSLKPLFLFPPCTLRGGSSSAALLPSRPRCAMDRASSPIRPPGRRGGAGRGASKVNHFHPSGHRTSSFSRAQPRSNRYHLGVTEAATHKLSHTGARSHAHTRAHRQNHTQKIRWGQRFPHFSLLTFPDRNDKVHSEAKAGASPFFWPSAYTTTRTRPNFCGSEGTPCPE